MYKAIEKLAWITGSLSLVGFILILFLQGTNKDAGKNKTQFEKKQAVLQFSRPASADSKKTASPAIATEPLKPEPETKEPVIEKPEKQIIKPVERKMPVEEPETPVRRVDNERKAVSRLDPPVSDNRKPEPGGRLFAESELDQMIGKIQAQRITYKSVSNCIQLRITADNNNTATVTQVERMLASKGYIIIGREKEDFLKGSGIGVRASGNCIRVTVGRK